MSEGVFRLEERRSQKTVVILVLNMALVFAGWFAKGIVLALGLLIYSCFAWLVYALRPSSVLHRLSAASDDNKVRRLAVVACLVTVSACTLPMGLSEYWNGSETFGRYPLDGYEVLADALIHGHVDVFWDEDTTALQSLDNPYDYTQRVGIDHHYDYAFYDGHYYLYFGIVPALIVFVPWQLLTGQSLPSYHATQLFTLLFIVGLFVLFRKLSRAFSLKVPASVYLLASSALSIMCALCAVETPALYCVAVMSALCFEAWSLVFFVEAVYLREGARIQVPFAVMGGLCGALVFGCRPTIGLMNILAIPMLVHYLSNRTMNMCEMGKVILVVLPYVLVMIALMTYNYVRFDSPFEFGAAYQITDIDVGAFIRGARQRGFAYVMRGLFVFFFWFAPWLGPTPMATLIPAGTFPFVNLGGVFINYPVLLLVFSLFKGSTLKALRKKGLLGITACLFILCIVAAVLIVNWSTFLVERYHMDIYPSLAILLFITCALVLERGDRKVALVACFLSCMFVLMLIKSFLLFCVPYDMNWTQLDPERLAMLFRVVFLADLFV